MPPMSKVIAQQFDPVNSAPPEVELLEWYFDRLWPLPRSLTGAGVRRTHEILGELLPLQQIEIPSGRSVFDWTVPQEWVVREAYVVAPGGRRLLNFADNNLHLVGYSVPFCGRLSRAELDTHLHSRPDLPSAIPYVTSYYTPNWGFCVSDAERQALPEGEYDVVVDTDLIDGSMTLSECVLQGETEHEVLISANTCHPSLASNELSGPLVAAFLYRRLAELPRRRLTYRFVFLPETIGAITYLHLRGDHLRERLVAGYVLTCLGDAGQFTYKRSRQGNSLADRAAQHVLGRVDEGAEILDFFPQGCDERQYCSPGFDLPVGCLMHTMYWRYPEYHTSLDNKDFISLPAMVETIDVCLEICRTLESDCRYRCLVPFGEPQLGKRGLYPNIGGANEKEARLRTQAWLLNLSDGRHSLLDIAERSGEAMSALAEAAKVCVAAGLLEKVSS
jgi:aminopeptidase-like protein